MVSICLSSLVKTRGAHGAGSVRVEDRRRRPAGRRVGEPKCASILGEPLVLEADRGGMVGWKIRRDRKGGGRAPAAAKRRHGAVFSIPYAIGCGGHVRRLGIPIGCRATASS